MSVRTSHKTVTFTRPFSLSALDKVQGAGTYTVETHEELLPGVSFPAWRRIATLLFLPSRPGGASWSRWSTLTRWSWKRRSKEMPPARRICSGRSGDSWLPIGRSGARHLANNRAGVPSDRGLPDNKPSHRCNS
jgi:hypothetical protein